MPKKLLFLSPIIFSSAYQLMTNVTESVSTVGLLASLNYLSLELENVFLLIVYLPIIPELIMNNYIFFVNMIIIN